MSNLISKANHPFYDSPEALEVLEEVEDIIKNPQNYKSYRNASEALAEILGASDE